MNRTTFAVLALLLSTLAVPAHAQSCEQPCTVLIVPDTAHVPLPLAGWMHELTNPLITIPESPLYGTWDEVNQTYHPGPDFWRIGIDRMSLQFNDELPQRLLLVAAFPATRVLGLQTFEEGTIGTWTFTGQSTLVATGRSSQNDWELALDGAGSTAISIPRDGAPINTGGGFGVINTPPCQTNCGGVFPPVDVYRISTPISSEESVVLVKIEFRRSGEITSVRAVASETLGCSGDACATSYHPLEDYARYDMTFSLGKTNAGGPDSNYALRFNVDREGATPPAHFEVSGLTPVDMNLDVDVEAGLIGESAGDYSIKIDDIQFWRQAWGAEDTGLLTRFDRFTEDGLMDEDWTQVGTVALAGPGNGQQAQINLAGMVPSSRNALADYLYNLRQRLRLQMTLDLGQLGLDNNDNIVVFSSYGNSAGSQSRVVDLFLRRLSNVYYLRARTVNDDGSVTSTELIPLSSGVNQIGLHWFAAPPSAGNGGLRLRVGSQVFELNGLANGNRTAGSFNFGVSTANLANNQASRYIGYDNITSAYH